MVSEDREIVQRVLRGERSAFERLVHKYNRLGGAIAYGVVGDFHLAEDIVQDAFIKAYRSLAKLRRPERFRFWFAGIVRKQAVDVARQRKPVALDPAIGEAERQPEGPGDLLEGLLRKERREKVREAISSLPEADRLVLVLKHLEGLSYKEIAEITGSTVGSIESRLFRARQALRKVMLRLLK